jgi:mRNA turnover protein 4
VEQIREAAAQYPHMYLFRVRNMRNVLFKNIRTESTGRFCIGKNKVMAVALGTEEASECIPGVAHLARRLRGDVGLYFSHDTPENVTEMLEKHESVDFARTGNKADMTVIVEADPMGLRNVETMEPLSATLEPQLRQAGMPTKLRGGSVLLAADQYVICREGETLTSDQSRLLKCFGIKMASFRVAIVGHLFDGKFEEFQDPFQNDDSVIEMSE